MNAPFSDGEIIRQSQQDNPVRVHLAGVPGILFSLLSGLWRAPALSATSLPQAFGGKLRGRLGTSGEGPVFDPLRKMAVLSFSSGEVGRSQPGMF